MNKLDPKCQAVMLEMIVGFEIEIIEVKFKEKMSQNRSVDDQKSVVVALKEQGDCGMSRVALIMSDNLKNEYE